MITKSLRLVSVSNANPTRYIPVKRKSEKVKNVINPENKYYNIQ